MPLPAAGEDGRAGIATPASASASASEVLVLGLGNPILTDDGVGVTVAMAVRDALPFSAVDVDELSVGGLRLMERMHAYRRVVLIDAMTAGTVPAGTVVRLEIEDLRTLTDTRHSISAHDVSLAGALDLGAKMSLPLPDEIVIVGIEVENVCDFGDRPTAAVEAAIPRAVETVLRELERWGVSARSDPDGAGLGSCPKGELP